MLTFNLIVTLKVTIHILKHTENTKFYLKFQPVRTIHLFFKGRHIKSSSFMLVFKVLLIFLFIFAGSFAAIILSCSSNSAHPEEDAKTY